MSDAPTLKMGNVTHSRGRTERIKSRWNRLLFRRAKRRSNNLEIEALMHAYQAADLRTRPPPEPPPPNRNSVIMTNHCDSDTYSVHTVNSINSDDSLFDGSLMDSWDKPIPTSCLHNFPSRLEDAKCSFFDGLSSDAESVSSIEYPNSDDDTYLSSNPISSRQCLHLTRVSAIPQVVGLSPCASQTTGGELVDSGGNFNMTNDLGLLLNVVAIRPFSNGSPRIKILVNVYTSWRFPSPND